MKQSEIKAGATYGNGDTLRTVTGIGIYSPSIAFTEGDDLTTQSCWLSAFARWAQFRVDGENAEDVFFSEQAVITLELAKLLDALEEAHGGVEPAEALF